MIYHVAKNGSDFNCGSEEKPFLTISKAASTAEEGSEIIVHGGEYREQVIIKKGSVNPLKRIVYRAAEGESVVVKGSEVIENWEKCGEIYKAVIPNSFFGNYNPYAEIIEGDWYIEPLEYRLHTGQVYINGISLLEVSEAEKLKNNNWYCEVGETETVIYAHFGNLNPYESIVEINVRKSCFEAECPGINNITISGFEICHTATQWSPPTAEQCGAVCANMCKGWIVENNHIHNSRCSGICIGRDKASGHNRATRFNRKTGHINQIEVVFDAVQRGWSKETAGGHIIRNNVIHDCGQAGIVGHLGCAFSEVYGNHIYNIQNSEEFWGHEISGIKFHAAIDTYIHNNCIHDCWRGLWLDWQAQGSRVSSNVMFNNTIQDDLFIEVTHGPQMVDNNILLSPVALRFLAQGNAVINNFIGGLVVRMPQARYTPYHYPHSTKMMGVLKVLAGDDRYYNNIFTCGKEKKEGVDYSFYGTSGYKGSTCSLEEYTQCCSEETIDASAKEKIMLPAYINNNSYTGGASPFDKEQNNAVTDKEIQINVVQEQGCYYLELDVPEEAFVRDTQIMSTDKLGETVITETNFENPDGSVMVIDYDYSGIKRGTNPVVGPFENLKPGKNKILLWK